MAAKRSAKQILKRALFECAEPLKNWGAKDLDARKLPVNKLTIFILKYTVTSDNSLKGLLLLGGSINVL